MKNRIYLTLAVSGIFLVQCSKETGNKGVLPKEIIPQKQLTKADFKKIAEETKKNLVTNLTQKISEKGAENALEFCNVNAIPLTESVAKNHKINIKRVSDQPRNQLNIANEKEIKYINLFKERIANGEKLKPEVVTQQLYVPIITNPMCLQCHGKIEESNPKLATKIKQLYPKDKATGYSENQVRGIFVVNLPK